MRERYPPTPPAFALYAVAGEGCRAGARRAQAVRSRPFHGLRLGKPFRCGELD